MKQQMIIESDDGDFLCRLIDWLNKQPKAPEGKETKIILQNEVEVSINFEDLEDCERIDKLIMAAELWENIKKEMQTKTLSSGSMEFKVMIASVQAVCDCLLSFSKWYKKKYEKED